MDETVYGKHWNFLNFLENSVINFNQTKGNARGEIRNEISFATYLVKFAL